MNIEKFFSDLNKDNPWNGTFVADYYNLTPKVKGTKGEKIVENILLELGYDVQPATNPGHDRIVNNIKTEIKFGLATKANSNWETIFNHISIQKDWEQILFVCINGDLKVRMVCFNKENLPQTLLNYQQGGKHIQNDDFMIAGKKAAQLMFDDKAEVIWNS